MQDQFDITSTQGLILKSADKRLVYGVVYEPESIDGQGEFAESEEIEKAAHRFLSCYRQMKVNHGDPLVAHKDIEVVESFIAPSDFNLAENYPVKKGSWVIGVKVISDALLAKIKMGELTGFSMGGVGQRVKVA